MIPTPEPFGLSSYNCISSEELCKLITTKQSDELFIVDTRFSFEFQAGHIKNALHINNPKDIEKKFFTKPLEKATIVFYDDYGVQRAPTIYQCFREIDRKKNMKEFPNLFYPNIFVLEKGFKNFFETCEGNCEGAYISMSDSRFLANGELKREMAEFKRGIRNWNTF